MTQFIDEPTATKTSPGRAAGPIVAGPDEMTIDWFRTALKGSGALEGADISAVELEPVEGGLMTRMVRAKLGYDGETDAPASVVVKFPTDDPGSLGLATAMGLYELEAHFYEEIAPLLPDMSVPECYLVRLSEDALTYNLILEDLAGRTRPGDVLTVSTLDECAGALGQLVNFQAPLWNSPSLSKFEWLADPRRTLGLFDSMSSGLEPFVARFGHGLDPEHITLFESVVPRAGEWARSWKAPTVVQHGDFRSDNLMFATTPDTTPVTVIDFQTIRLGPPGVDAAYFLGSSLSTEARRAAERDLISDYHQRLVSSGVEDFDSDSCWSAYREGALYGVFLFVGIASQVESTERGDRVIIDQIRRYADMALDLEAAKAAGLL